MLPSLHEDTLNAVEFAYHELRDREWTRQHNQRYEGEDVYTCVGCCARHNSRWVQEEDRKHEPNCRYLAHMATLKAFIDIEQELHFEQGTLP